MRIKPAQATLNELNGGKLMIQLAEEIHAAVAAVKLHGKPATVSLDITISVIKDQNNLVNPAMMFAGEVTSKLPKAPPPLTLFFLDEDGNPTRNQAPRDPELGLSIAKTNTQT